MNRTACLLIAAILLAPAPAAAADDATVPRSVTAVANGDFGQVDFGTVRAGQTLKLTVNPPAGYAITKGTASGGDPSRWEGSLTQFYAAIRSSQRGVHNGAFAGEMVPLGPGTEPPPTVTWAGSAKADLLSVTITTQGSGFQVRQERDSAQTLTAERSPSGGAIAWTVTGPGKDFVEWQADGTNPSTITIKIKTPVSNAWDRDSMITVRAADSVHSEVGDERSVNLIKFKRDYTTKPGSQPIKVALSYVGESSTRNAGITSDQEEYQQVTVTDDIEQTIEQKTPVDPKSANWKAFYKGQGDACKGKASVRALGKVLWGRGSCVGTYGGWFHNASVYMAAGVAAGVDNSALPITDPACGAGYNGTLVSHSISLGIGYDGKPSAQLGYSVSFSCSQQDSLRASCSPSGSGVIDDTPNQDHSAGGTIERPHTLNTGASVALQQIDDDEWFLHASAHLVYDVAGSGSEITFNPDI